MKDEHDNKELSRADATTSITASGLTFKSFDEMKKWGEEIIKSGLAPQATGGAVVAAVLMGKELGLEAMVSVNNIYSVNGKASLGIHIINSLLLKAGVVTEVIRDYEACVGFALKGEDGKAYKGDDGLSSPTLLRIGFIDELPREHEVRGKIIVDYKTIVKMTRMLKQPDGTFATATVTASFSYSDAVTAKLMDKANWKMYPKQMCLQRATAFAGRAIGADILNGMYETSELLDIHNIDYTIEDGKITSIKDPNTKANPKIADAEEVEDVSDHETDENNKQSDTENN